MNRPHFQCQLEEEEAMGFFKEMGDSITLNNPKEMSRFFRYLHQSPSWIEQGTEGEISEKYSLYCFFHYLQQSDQRVFPVQIHKRESPDFEIQIGKQAIGLEHTRATTEHFMSHSASWRAKDMEWQGNKYVPRNGKKHSRKLMRYLNNHLKYHANWNAELFWGQQIWFAVQRKAYKLQCGHFSQFQRNQLLIVDETPVKKRIDPAKALYYLRRQLLAAPKNLFTILKFHRIMIVSEDFYIADLLLDNKPYPYRKTSSNAAKH